MKLFKRLSDIHWVNALSITLVLVGIIAILPICKVAQGTADTSFFLAAFSIFLLIGFSSLLIGGLIGFLFGIPKRNEEGSSNNKYTPNTNLENVSDWLSKIIIGAGLTQMKDLLNWIYTIAGIATNPLAVTTLNKQMFAAAVIIYFLISGFIVGYLLTRIHLPRIFNNTEAQ